MAAPVEHPFARFVRELGRGRTGARSLDAAEAEAAMGMILDGAAEPAQVGAFLMLLRVKEETPTELAGFVRAARRRIAAPPADLAVDLDWPSYAGKRQHHPWFLLAALLLACNGHRVLMHGCEPHAGGRLFAADALAALGLPAAHDVSGAARALAACGFAYLPLRALSPPLQDLLNLRALLGLRSPVNTFMRHLNPFGARASLLSLHHPAYAALHAETVTATHPGCAAIFRGEGGECELKPDAETRCLLASRDGTREHDWPRALPARAVKPSAARAAPLRELWDGTAGDAYGENAVIHTAAAGLLALGVATDAPGALDATRAMWNARPAWGFDSP